MVHAIAQPFAPACAPRHPQHRFKLARLQPLVRLSPPQGALPPEHFSWAPGSNSGDSSSSSSGHDCLAMSTFTKLLRVLTSASMLHNLCMSECAGEWAGASYGVCVCAAGRLLSWPSPSVQRAHERGSGAPTSGQGVDGFVGPALLAGHSTQPK